MSDRVNSQPPEVTADAASPKMAVAKQKAAAAKDVAVRYLRKNPLAAVAVGFGVLATGYYFYPTQSGTPVTQAGLLAQPSKTVSSGRQTEIEMVVGSFRKTSTILILNNHSDHRQATMNVVVDLKTAPELAAIDGRSLKGLTVRARGESQTYEGKPQVMVRRAADLRVDEGSVSAGKK